MGDFMNNRFRKNLSLIIIASVFLFMFLLNIKTYFTSDDYVYQFVFTGRYPTEDTKLIGNFFDIFISMTNHWNLWGGRVFNHGLLQFFFMLGKIPFDLVNSFMFVLLGLLVYCHVIVEKSYKPFLLLTIYASIFVLSPQPGLTFIWKSGSANYLWVGVFFLFISLIYKRYYDSGKTCDTIWRILLMFILGIIVGCGSENGSVAMIFLLLLYIFLYKKKSLYVPKWAIFGLIGSIIGYVFLILAPGNYIRADLLYVKKELSINSLFEELMEIVNFTYQFLNVIIIGVIVSLILIYNKKKKDNIFSVYSVQIIFLFATVVSIFSLVLSPYTPERSWFFAFIFLLVTFFINIAKINWKKECLGKVVICAGAIIIFISISCYSQAYTDINDSQIHLADEMRNIKDQIASGEKDIVVYDVVTCDGRYNAFKDNGYLTGNKDSWFNLWMAKYLDVDSIVVGS